MTTDERKIQRRRQFQTDIRRTEYIRQTYNSNLQWMFDSEECPRRLKSPIQNVLNANRRLHLLILDHYRDEQIKEIQDELTSEYLKDLGLLLDELQNIPDLTGIIEAIQKSKQ